LTIEIDNRSTLYKI